MKWVRGLAYVMYVGWCGYMGSALVCYSNVVGSTVSSYVCRGYMYMYT